MAEESMMVNHQSTPAEVFNTQLLPNTTLSSATTSEHGMTTEDNQMIPETIPLYYKNTSVFITGVTGFLGKSILEKLLRSCPDVDKIFVLVRTKKGHNPFERVESLFNSKVFDRAQLERGMEECKKKVVAIAGDVLEDNLGISEEDEQMLISSNVSTVIHSAATIRFDEPLRFALALNVGGTLKVINLCKKLPNLKALVHVSTAYANCDMPFIEEQVYPPPVSPQKLLDAITWMSDEAAAKITPVLIGNKPNTYTFTKHLAENLLIEEAADQVPYIIVRPSIVGASWKEPFPGWIDNFNGPSGLFIACGMGLLRSMIGNPDAIADIVPVDIVSNCIIAAPWYRACVMIANNCLVTNNIISKFDNANLNCELTNSNSNHLNNFNNDSTALTTADATTPSATTTLHPHVDTNPTIEETRFAVTESNSSLVTTTKSNDHLNHHQSNMQCSEVVSADSGAPTTVNSRRSSNQSHHPSIDSLTECNSATNPIETIVINCCSGYAHKSMTWGMVPVAITNQYLRTPIGTALRYPNCKITPNKMMYFLWVFTCHRVPALLMDLYMRMIGKKPRMMSMYRKLHRSMDTLSFFTQRHWEWEVKSLRHMQHVIQQQHQLTTLTSSTSGAFHEWNTSVKDIDWNEYLETFCVGTKCFVLNEEMSDLHLAKRRMSKLKTLHYLFNIFTAAIVWRVIMVKSEVACKLSNVFVRFFLKWIETLRLSRFITL